MYNGIGLTTVRGSGTSGYVQTNKFNLRNQRPTGKPLAKPGDPGSEGPKQTKANEAILEHNRKREVEKKLLELQDELIDKGFAEDEIMERLNARRQELLMQAEEQSNQEKVVSETHALAKKKAAEMDKMRNAFGFSENQKEGQAFDRELQEQLKQERILAKEKAQRDKEKAERKRKKALKKEEKKRKKDEKKKAKEDAKRAVEKAKEEKRLKKEREAREAERAKIEAEAKRKRQADLQARLGPRPGAEKPHDPEPKRRRHDSPPAARFEEAEARYVPRGIGSDDEDEIIPGSPLMDDVSEPPAEPSSGPSHLERKREDSHPRAQDSGFPSEQPSSLSPAIPVHRSETPSPSPRQAAGTRKRAPSPRTLSPERSGPRASPPPRKRTRISVSLSPVPPRRQQYSPDRRRNGYEGRRRAPEGRYREEPRRGGDDRRRSPSPARRYKSSRRSPVRDVPARRHREPSPRRHPAEQSRRQRHDSPSPPRRSQAVLKESRPASNQHERNGKAEKSSSSSSSGTGSSSSNSQSNSGSSSKSQSSSGTSSN